MNEQKDERRRVGVRVEWFKRFFAFGVLVFCCMCVCVHMEICVSVWCPLLAGGGGGVMAAGRRQSTRLVCSLLFVSRVQLLARGQRSERGVRHYARER